MQIQQALVQGFSQGQGPLVGTQAVTPLVLRQLLHVLEEDSAAALVLHILEMFGTLAFFH